MVKRCRTVSELVLENFTEKREAPSGLRNNAGGDGLSLESSPWGWENTLKMGNGCGEEELQTSVCFWSGW